LKLTAPGAADAEEGVREVARRGGWRATRSLWIGLAVLMIATPLGLLAAGTAWGEWGAQDFANPVLRQQIALASGNQAPPTQAPRGLAQVSSIWTAPIPGYAPPFLKSAE